MPVENRAFDFPRINDRPEKPRDRGVTEIRGPYYAPMGPRQLRDILETMGHDGDIYKFSGGSFALMPEDAVRELIETCHEFDVQVSTGGFIENVLVRDHDHVEGYVVEEVPSEIVLLRVCRSTTQYLASKRFLAESRCW